MADTEYRGPDEHAPSRAPAQEEAEWAADGDAGGGLCPQHLQKELAKLADCTRLRRLENTLQQQSSWGQLERLRELRHPEVSHKWLWHLDSTQGSVLAQCDYTLNVQKRLGARVFEAVVSCRLCGTQMEPCLEHSEVCATAEATRGHYACVRALVDGFKMADPGVTTEPRGLTSTAARPADIPYKRGCPRALRGPGCLCGFP